jgi:hypothetical protein
MYLSRARFEYASQPMLLLFSVRSSDLGIGRGVARNNVQTTLQDAEEARIGGEGIKRTGWRGA